MAAHANKRLQVFSKCTLIKNQKCLGLLESINRSRVPKMEEGLVVV